MSKYYFGAPGTYRGYVKQAARAWHVKTCCLCDGVALKVAKDRVSGKFLGFCKRHEDIAEKVQTNCHRGLSIAFAHDRDAKQILLSAKLPEKNRNGGAGKWERGRFDKKWSEIE